ncbi:hypothetical protein ABZT03_07585 [Streptomyces sp. NPDC005574]|uniref:hypothetical protein n=1 Tax=Streptomyces sp. NPDC005574 TaxID=3156891 RepID=UPI0033A82794
MQRLWNRSKKEAKATHRPAVRTSATGALAAAAAATVHSTLPLVPHPPAREHRADPPPPYTPHGSTSQQAPPPYSPPARTSSSAHAPTPPPPPEYTAVPAGGFDPRELTDFQLDELVHRIIGRITRLIRTELRMDRERIGKLRDPRH